MKASFSHFSTFWEYLMQLKPKDSKCFHKKEAKNIRKLHFGFFCPAILKYSSSNVLLRKENIVAQKCKTSQIALKILKILRKKSVVASNSWRTCNFRKKQTPPQFFLWEFSQSWITTIFKKSQNRLRLVWF